MYDRFKHIGKTGRMEGAICVGAILFYLDILAPTRELLTRKLALADFPGDVD